MTARLTGIEWHIKYWTAPQELIDGFTNYYNHIKIQTALGTTLAQAAKIGITTEGNRWLQLINAKSIGP
jgi:hypothetical protein